MSRGLAPGSLNESKSRCQINQIIFALAGYPLLLLLLLLRHALETPQATDLLGCLASRQQLADLCAAAAAAAQPPVAFRLGWHCASALE